MIKHLPGSVYGLLTVKGKGPRAGTRICVCKCGQERVVLIENLSAGRSRSCGSCGRKTHAESDHPEYQAWKSLKQRCLNPKNPAFKDYGGRGISVDPRWEASFQAFLNDVGKKPFKAAQLDRIDNDKGYEPGNCRWVTASQNLSNRRNSVLLTYEGETHTVAEWARRLGIKDLTIRGRLRGGKSVEEALSIHHL